MIYYELFVPLFEQRKLHASLILGGFWILIYRPDPDPTFSKLQIQDPDPTRNPA